MAELPESSASRADRAYDLLRAFLETRLVMGDLPPSEKVLIEARLHQAERIRQGRALEFEEPTAPAGPRALRLVRHCTR